MLRDGTKLRYVVPDPSHVTCQSPCGVAITSVS
jgi:hypothetical protein